MQYLKPDEIIRLYAEAGGRKAALQPVRMFTLAVMAGLFIAFGGAVTSTAAHSIANVSLARVVCGLLFPAGLCMTMLMGAELFTGNCMMPISVLEKKTTLPKMLRSWVIVYLGNFTGALLVAAGCAYYGQFGYSGGGLAVYTVQVAAGKCTIPFASGFVLGMFCNVLVCVGVLCCLSAKDTAGRILGAYIPVMCFVVCGFEHCIANMYFVPAGLFALRVPAYGALVAQAGVDISSLTWGNFLLHNLLPVTAGNILGGAVLGVALWYAHRRAVVTNRP